MSTLNYSCKSFSELSLSELYDILALRQEVFIVEQTCYYQDADYKDQEGYHLMGKDADARIQSYARILPQVISYPDYGSIGRIITSEKYRGKGAGKELMNQSILCYQRHIGETPIKISAQSHLVTFYNQFGFISTGEEYLEDGIPHTGMVRK